MGVCFGTPDFPTPTFAGNPKSGAKWNITTSSSSAASNSCDSRPLPISSSAASNSHALLAAHGKKAFRDGKTVADASLTIFSFAELKAATKNFPADALLGKGGFGCVYKGMLPGKQPYGIAETMMLPGEQPYGSAETTMLPGKQPYGSAGTIIAVKILNQNGTQGYREWLREIAFIGKISHPNLAKLVGFCPDDKNLALVYEFMPMGSLEYQLFREVSADHLSWDLRLKIAVGAARGLAFLHNSCNMIHRDFKSANILLDESYMAKLSDFGLVRSGPLEDKSHVSTQFMGTTGYCDPEYRATGRLTVESDVYSFGVVLLEILTGCRAFDPSSPADRVDLVEWTRPYLSGKRKPRAPVDTRLQGEYCVDSVRQIAQLANKCVGLNPKSRPSMSEVVEKLESIEAVSAKGILRNV